MWVTLHTIQMCFCGGHWLFMHGEGCKLHFLLALLLSTSLLSTEEGGHDIMSYDN